jgi:anti-sigma regulatory factor (Ser/Thr protein kinase)
MSEAMGKSRGPQHANHSPGIARGSPRAQAAATFPDTPAAVAQSRQFVRDMLVVWDADDLTDIAELLTSELVTNAIRHAMTNVDLHLAWSPPTLRIAVHDQAHAAPVMVETPDEHGGFGLHLITALAHTLGVEHQPDGKTVWCQITHPNNTTP